jgi:hypothetical protein
MRKLTSREIVLLLVVGGLAVLGWYYGSDGGLGGVGVKAAELAELKYGDPPVVELARLELAAVGYDPKARNLFSYYTPPPPPRPKPPPTVQTKTPQRETQPQAQVQRPPALPKAEPKPPRPNFRYIGFLGPKDNKIAVLEQGQEILLASIGEVIQEQYTVVDFKYEMLVIGYTDERWGDQTTDLPMKR